jgi:NADPH:quinone reductase-like Zn-dependent oxidoreductase
MKAAFRTEYGPPEVLRIKEVPRPSPLDDELLISVHATTVNRTDCAILFARPFIMRFFTGLVKPRLAITGTDVAGHVEAIGKDVRSFKVGDRVIGFDGFGLQSHAAYLTVRETKGIVKIPDEINYEHAAACAEAAYYALDCVRMVKPGEKHKALVYGATGGIGSSMVQFLKFFGVYVSAVCGGEHSELVRSLGADKVIDYKTVDFTKDSERYDFVFDAVGKTSFGACKSLLKEKGIFASTEPNLLQVIFTPLSGGKKAMFRPPGNIRQALTFICELVEKGSFRPLIDRTYSLDEIAEAFRYVATGEKIGNVIIKVQ